MKRIVVSVLVSSLGSALVIFAAGPFVKAPVAMAQSGYYLVTLTRIVQNVYRDTSSGVLILTRGCYEYVYWEDAVLRWDGYGGRLLFSTSNSTCDVRALYRPNASLTRVEHDLYRDARTGYYLRTRFCYVYAYLEDALVLDGEVIFIDSRDQCDAAYWLTR